MYCGEDGPRLSVVMGVYNIALLEIFRRAVASVLGQTMANFEFIICDDGSTDSTWNILSSLAETDKRIILVRNDKNRGLAYALNHCIEVAKGEFIARQDADDISSRERFEKQIEFLDTHLDISIVGSNVTLWDESGVWGERVFPEYPKPNDFLFTQPFVHGALMLRKHALMTVNGYRVSPETYRTEDYDLLMRMYAVGLQGANIQENLYYFLENSASQRRRKYRYRVDEAVVRWRGFWSLGLMPKALPFVIKPLVVGLIPCSLLNRLKRLR